MSCMFGMTWGWFNDNGVFILGELSLQAVLAIYFWALKTMSRSLVHVSVRLLWACTYHEIRLCNLLSTSCLSWVGRPERSLSCVYVCLGVSGVAVWVIFFFVHGSVQHSISQGVRSLSFSYVFFSDRLIFASSSSYLSSDDENPDCFMPKRGLSTQPHST